MSSLSGLVLILFVLDFGVHFIERRATPMFYSSQVGYLFLVSSTRVVSKRVVCCE